MSQGQNKSNLSGKEGKTSRLLHGASPGSEVKDDFHNDGGSEVGLTSEAVPSPAEEALDKHLPFKRRKSVRAAHGIVQNSETGCSFQMRSSINTNLGSPSHSEQQPPSPIKASHTELAQKGEFLFKKTLESGERIWLHIPTRKAKRYFPSLQKGSDGRYQECVLDIMDYEESTWKMNFTCSHCSYWLTGQWKDFVKKHSLKTDDVICFFKSKELPDDKHYIIEFQRQGGASVKDDQDDDGGVQVDSASEALSVHSEEEFDKSLKACNEGGTSKRKPEGGSGLEMLWEAASDCVMLNSKSGCSSEIRNNSKKLELPSHSKHQLSCSTETIDDELRQQRVHLFAKFLTRSDIQGPSLYIPRIDAENYLPTLRTDARTYKEEVLSVVDHEGNTWEMTFKQSSGMYRLGTLLQWKSFVENHQLQPVDMIRFYRPNNAPPDNKRFFVEFRRLG